MEERSQEYAHRMVHCELTSACAGINSRCFRSETGMNVAHVMSPCQVTGDWLLAA